MRRILVIAMVAGLAVIGVLYLLATNGSSQKDGAAISRYIRMTLPESDPDFEKWQNNLREFTFVYSFSLSGEEFDGFVAQNFFKEMVAGPSEDPDIQAMRAYYRRVLVKEGITHPDVLNGPLTIYARDEPTTGISCTLVTDANRTRIYVRCTRV